MYRVRFNIRKQNCLL